MSSTLLRQAAVLGLALSLCAPLWGQRWHQRDPLTAAEADRLRDLAQDPTRRLRALMEFAEARMAALDQVRADVRLREGRGEQIRELLEEFSRLADELGGNIEMYADQGADLRRPLKEVIEATVGWQLKLRAMREPGEDGDHIMDYEFTLEDAADSVQATAELARSTLDEQLRRREKDKRDTRRKKKE